MFVQGWQTYHISAAVKRPTPGCSTVLRGMQQLLCKPGLLTSALLGNKRLCCFRCLRHERPHVCTQGDHVLSRIGYCNAKTCTTCCYCPIGSEL